MNKIDTSKWKEFSLKSLGFTIYHGKRIKKSERIEGNIIFLTAGKENRGVAGTIGNDVELWNCPITIDMFGNSFYHDYKCSGDDNIYAFVNDNLNKFVKMFIASVINTKNTKMFSYIDQFRQKDADTLSVKLPITLEGFPDFKYMETYMKNLELAVNSSLSDLQSAKKFDILGKIDISNWKQFQISDLFTVKRPSARNQANYDDGDVPFVASGNFNNGVLKYLEPKKDEILDVGNCITVSPIDGSSFYQEDDFIGRGGAGSSIILLYNPNLNPYNGYFIATVIRTVCRKYAYSDMANKDTIGAEKIKLPVDETGNPDYKYMENYILNKLSKLRNLLNNLQLCI